MSSKGHPFHRHEGHRCFTAVSGSSGSRLGFSHASPVRRCGPPSTCCDVAAAGTGRQPHLLCTCHVAVVCRWSDSQQEVEERPMSFVEKLAFVEVPPDTMFTVRFNG